MRSRLQTGWFDRTFAWLNESRRSERCKQFIRKRPGVFRLIRHHRTDCVQVLVALLPKKMLLKITRAFRPVGGCSPALCWVLASGFGRFRLWCRKPRPLRRQSDKIDVFPSPPLRQPGRPSPAALFLCGLMPSCCIAADSLRFGLDLFTGSSKW